MTEVSTEALITQSYESGLYCPIEPTESFSTADKFWGKHLIVNIQYLYRYDLLAD